MSHRSAGPSAAGDLPRQADAPAQQDYAEAIVAALHQPVLVLDGHLVVEAANPAFYRVFQTGPDETVGLRLYDLGNGQWNIPELRTLLEDVLRHQPVVEDYRVEHEFERIGRRAMLLNARHMERVGSDRILLVIADITEPERLRRELEGQKEFAEKIVDAVRDPLIVLGWDLKVRQANQPFYETFMVDRAETEGRVIYELGNGQWNIPSLRELLENVLPDNNAFDDFVVEHRFEQIGQRVMVLNARRLDHLDLILLAIEDITERRRAESRQQALMGELHHRIKNILMNVRALARQTQRASGSLDEFMAAFDGRLDTLARTQDQLLGSTVEPVALEALVRHELSALGAEEGREFVIDGPPVQLPAAVVQPMAMTVHELATNAAKYGALAAANGRLEIIWRTEQREEGCRLRLEWRESGLSIGHAAIRRGFGTRLIEMTLPHAVGGSCDLAFTPEGVRCVLDFPLRTG